MTRLHDITSLAADLRILAADAAPALRSTVLHAADAIEGMWTRVAMLQGEVASLRVRERYFALLLAEDEAMRTLRSRFERESE